MSDGYVLELESVEKSYFSASETLTILKDLTLRVEAGKKIIITGESGCGKSTLLNIIGGLDTVSSGTIRAGSWNISSLDENSLTEYRSRFLGLVFQFHYLLKDFTALENVFLPAYMAGMPRRKAEERAKQLLSDVGLEKRLTHYPSQLSGGERQRAAVARSLINNPELLLADEPTGNLDPANAAVIEDMLFNVVERYSKTLLLVTHDRGLLDRGDTSYRLENGRLSEI